MLQNGIPSNLLQTGWRPIFDEAEKLQLEAFITRDSGTQRLSWKAVCQEMGYACSADTVKHVMERLGYYWWVPRRKFTIYPANKPLHVAWYREHLNWTYQDWLWVVWTDESMFSTAGFRNRPWVMRKATEEYHEDCVDETFESGRQSKMVWGAFCGTLKSQLVFVPTKAKVDSSFYVTKIMYPSLVLPFWHPSCEQYSWTTVVEDGALGHKGFSICYRDLNGMETTRWPA